MPLRGDEIDYICGECGKVVSGPHAGQTMKPGERQQLGDYGYYRGSPISDTTCEDCQRKPGGYEDQMTQRHGPNWRDKLKPAQEEPKKPHIWWRKIGE